MTEYLEDHVVRHNGIGYVAIQNHTAVAATNEPGVGLSWHDYWRLQEWHFPGELVGQETNDQMVVYAIGTPLGVDGQDHAPEAATISGLGDILGLEGRDYPAEMDTIDSVGDTTAEEEYTAIGALSLLLATATNTVGVREVLAAMTLALTAASEVDGEVEEA